MKSETLKKCITIYLKTCFHCISSIGAYPAQTSVSSTALDAGDFRRLTRRSRDEQGVAANSVFVVICVTGTEKESEGGTYAYINTITFCKDKVRTILLRKAQLLQSQYKNDSV